MKFSLIIGTLNRLEAIKSCLNSINNQTYKDYEVIIIDQSESDETERYISNVIDNRIVYRHVSFRGLSRARNEALKLARGEYICLMDDDAYYDDRYLERAYANCDPNKVLSGYIYDTMKQTDFVSYRDKFEKHKMQIREIMRTCPSAALIIPRGLIDKCGFFDERFGVGAEFGSGEETDLLLRGIKRGFVIEYIPDMTLKHPVPIKEGIVESVAKRAKYFEGLGALYKKHLIIEGMRELKWCYVEVWLKFYIKKLLFFKYSISDTNKLISGFKKGLENMVQEPIR